MGLRRLERELAAALEVDAEVEPLDASEPIPIRSTVPETANQNFVRPMKSTRCQDGIFCALAPMKAGC
jgi:hypothetical protein